MVLAATLNDPDGAATVRIEVEVQPILIPFTNRPTAAGPLVARGGQGTVSVTGLLPLAGYRWQARAVDETGRASDWVSFGGNAELAVDFSTSL